MIFLTFSLIAAGVIKLSGDCSVRILRTPDDPLPRQSRNSDEPTIVISASDRLKRAGFEMKLLVDNAAVRRKPDLSLIRLLAQSHRYHAMVMRGDGRSITALATEAGVARSYSTRVLRLRFLAPDIIKAVLHNRHPHDLTANRLVNNSRFAIA